MYSRVVLGGLLTATLACLSGAAIASTIDFRSAVGADGDATWSTTVDGVGVKVSSGPSGTSLYWDSTDGFGVRGGKEVDEIDPGEWLTVAFSDEVTVGEVYLTDLFKEQAGWMSYREAGTYALDGNIAGTIVADPSATQSNGNGTQTITVASSPTKSIVFKANSNTNLWQQLNGVNNDYSVAGLTFQKAAASVPELDGKSAYGAIGLLLGGLLTGTGRRRRDDKKNKDA